MRILVAEDDLFYREMLESILRNAGYDPLSVDCGDEALKILQGSSAPRLAILDWMMPGISGLDVCRKMQNTSGTSRPYLILLTSKGEKESIVTGLNSGADDYVVKPFESGELEARIRAGLRSLSLKEAPQTELTLEADSEPIPGYRLLEKIGQGGFGEVWKCEAPGCLYKAIKFVQLPSLSVADTDQNGNQELDALQKIKEIQHPFIIGLDRIEVVNGTLIIVMELGKHNLAHVLQGYRMEGKSGIPRKALLKYLEDVAEVLDFLTFEHHLQHLDIKPHNLFEFGRHVKVGDFGLVTDLNELHLSPADTGLAHLTPLYSAPELFRSQISPHSDQYSLAIVFQELLTSTLPFDGTNPRQLMCQHLTEEPNLKPLPDEDRPIIARALSKDPRERFLSCTELIEALDA